MEPPQEISVATIPPPPPPPPIPITPTRSLPRPPLLHEIQSIKLKPVCISKEPKQDEFTAQLRAKFRSMRDTLEEEEVELWEEETEEEEVGMI
jgi:hypothetical protein